MKKYTSFFEDILRVLATLSIILLIVGYVDLKTYYSYFGVNISNYLNASEIIIVSFDSLTINLISLLLQLSVWLYFFDHFFDWTEDDLEKYWEGKRRPKLYSDDLTITRFVESKSMRIFALAIFILAIISGTIKQFYPTNHFFQSATLFFGLNMFMFMLVFLWGLFITKTVLIRAKKQDHYNPQLIVAFVIFLPSLLLTIYIKNQMFEGNRIRKYGNQEKIIVTLNHEIILQPNDSVRYIGRTENYFFFWNKNNWTNTIVPNTR